LIRSEAGIVLHDLVSEMLETNPAAMCELIQRKGARRS